MQTRLPLLLLLICLSVLPGRAQETGLAACADGMDNDGNGLTDCDDPACARLTEGCRLCGETSSFADSVLTFREGCGRRTVNPRSTLGVADFAVSPTNNSRYMITGEGGWLKLAFTDNILINSGNTEPDIHVFEVEAILQETRISLRPLDDFTRDALIARGVPDTDGDGFFEFGIVDMNRRNLDIDGRISGFARGLLRFDAVEVRDIDDGNCRSAETPGMDLDAVCALSSLPVTDCNGVRFGPGVVDDCGICLERTDPAFNQSCADCAGVPSGPAVVDSCGVCLPREDPGFGQSCRDCLGVTNGTAAPDSCGVCRAPGDVAFNSTCRDCAGVLNGPARTDDCGICRDTTDARFNLGCGPPRNVYLPNAFSPNADGVNDRHRGEKDRGLVATIVSYRVFDRWGALVFENRTADFDDGENWWNGEFRGREAPAGTYLYQLIVGFGAGEQRLFSGGVLLVR